MDEIKLDAKDRKILYELEANSRQPISQIARKIRLSKETTNYRIKQLEKNGVISGYSTLINWPLLGYDIYMIFLRFQNTTPEKEEEIIEYFRKLHSLRLTSVEGSWDLFISVKARKIREFKNIYDNFITKYGKYIHHRYVSIVTQIRHFKHSFLYDSDERSYFAFSEKGPVKLDEKDQIILSLLENNSRMPNQDIAKKVKLTANAAKHRIERLIKEKVILNFRTKIVDEPLKYQFNHIMLTLQDMDKAKRDRLMSALCNDPLVYSIVESIGEADLEFEIHTKDSSELHNKLKELRSKFDFIKDHQTILLCQPSLLR